MSSNYSDRETNIIKANRMLQAKVGSGSIDEKRIEQSQALIDSDKTDFAPMASEYLGRLETALANIPEEPANVKIAIQPIIVEIMQLKANAAMFSYGLVGTLANIVLNFLENLHTWDKDALAIIDAHIKTLRIIVRNGMKGDGGDYGHQLTNELRDACQRYFTKKSGVTGNGDALFIDSE